MKILLFGNKGQVGRELEELALAKGFDVIGFDIDDLDIAKPDLVDYIFSSNQKVDIVINAAAYTAVDIAEDEPLLSQEVNCKGVENLALACKENGLPLLHISTDYIFDGNKLGQYSEDDKPNPASIYGKTKLAGEQALIDILPEHIILRISWVFGRYGNNFVKTILRLATEREELNIVNDQYGCPTPAKDAARVLLELAEKIYSGERKWGIYNYCGFPVTTWFSFATRIITLAREQGVVLKVNKVNGIATKEYPTKAVRPNNSELLIKKIVEDYKIERHDWEGYLVNVIKEVI